MPLIAKRQRFRSLTIRRSEVDGGSAHVPDRKKFHVTAQTNSLAGLDLQQYMRLSCQELRCGGDMKICFSSLLFVVIALTISRPAHAQAEYPARNIRLLFGFSAGNDVGTRIVAEKLAERLGKPVAVENTTGAAG